MVGENAVLIESILESYEQLTERTLVLMREQLDQKRLD